MRTIKRTILSVKVEATDLNYKGSIDLPRTVMEEHGILENEKVSISNRLNGEFFETYAVTGGGVCLNGAAARKVEIGDVIDIITWETK